MYRQYFFSLIASLFFLQANAQVTIDFESIPTTVVGAGGVSLGNQLVASGVTFNFPTLLDYSASPGFVHSGKNAIELCYGKEFCTAPLRATFNVAQSHVKIWVGYSYQLNSLQTVIMNAFTARGQLAASSTIVLGATTTWDPVSSPIEVNTPIQEIKYVEVGFLGASTGAIYNNDLVFDDLEFNSLGAPPACPATMAPTLALASPADGAVFLQNSFTIAGTITTAYNLTDYPYLTATLKTTDASGNNKTSGPFFINNKDWNLAGLTDFLYNGQNTLSITITDCAGSTTTTRTIYYRPDVKSTTIKVINQFNVAVPNAQVYANRSLLGRTNRAGELTVTPALTDGVNLAARGLLYTNGNGFNYSFNVYLTSITIGNDGSAPQHIFSLEPDPTAVQVLQLLPTNVLVGMHMKASIEWDASDAEIEDTKQRFSNASNFIYNATDGQVLFEQVDIEDDGQNWDGSDYHIYGNQGLRSHTPTWFGNKEMDMARPARIGQTNILSTFQTYVHELGHYKFRLGDEYSDDDPNTRCSFLLEAPGLPPAQQVFFVGGAKAACIMHNQTEGGKYCSNRGENPHVQGTGQGGKACWTDIADVFSDPSSPAMWQIQTPDTRGAIVGTINGGVIPISDWAPRFSVVNHSRGPLCAPFQIAFNEAGGGAPLANTDVWLNTTYGQSILQGKTGPNGEAIWVTGVHAGDNFNQWVTITPQFCTTIQPFSVMRQLGPLQPERVSLVPLSAKGQVQVTLSGATRSNPSAWLYVQRKAIETAFHLDKKTGKYTGTLKQVPAGQNNHLVVRYGDSLVKNIAFSLSPVSAASESTISSADGSVEIVLKEGALPRNSSVIIGPSLQPAPTGQYLLSTPIQISSTGNSSPKTQVTLRFFAPPVEKNDSAKGKRAVAVMRFNTKTKKWEHLPGIWIPFQTGLVSVKIRLFGDFVLVGR